MLVGDGQIRRSAGYQKQPPSDRKLLQVGRFDFGSEIPVSCILWVRRLSSRQRLQSRKHHIRDKGLSFIETARVHQACWRRDGMAVGSICSIDECARRRVSAQRNTRRIWVRAGCFSQGAWRDWRDDGKAVSGEWSDLTGSY